MNILNLKPHLPGVVFEQLPMVIDKYGMSTSLRLSHFLGQCSHESAVFKRVTENLNYSAEGLIKIFPSYFTPELAKQYARNPQKIASRVYGNRLGNGDEKSGEGYKFRGRGYIQLTGKYNYYLFSKYMNMDFINYPDLVAEKFGLVCSGWYFQLRNINPISDKGITKKVIEEVTSKINPKLLGLEHRITETNRFYQILETDMGNPRGVFKTYIDFMKSKVHVKKVIMNMYICDRESPNWKESVEIYNDIDYPTSVGIGGSSHIGLGVQVLLDTNLEDSIKFAEHLVSLYPETPLIVLAEVDIVIEDSNNIGRWQQECLVSPGRWFDKLLSEGKRGIFIHDKTNNT